MKRTGFLIDKIADLENISLAAYKAFRGKQGAKNVRDFRSNFMENIMSIRSDILNGTPKVGNYHRFTIYEPKERLICAAPLEQRILHHSIMNICHDIFDKHLIYDTYASRPEKGIHKAILRLKSKASEYIYYAKLDVRKFFDSINHQLLKKHLRRLFKDLFLLSIFDSIIDSYGSEKGVPIGNLTSQYFANFYLSSLDHYMKETVRCKVYLRYMDDVIILARDKTQLKEYVNAYCCYAGQNLKLEIKPPIIGLVRKGIPFLGYKVFRERIYLNGKSKRRYKRNVKRLNKLFENEIISELEYAQRLQSMIAFTKFADSQRFRMKHIG